LNDLAQELVDHPSAAPPALVQLERRARTIRRRSAAARLGAVGVVVAVLAAVAVWAGTHQHDALPPAEPGPDMPHPPDLQPIGPEVTVASGVIDGGGAPWRLVAYEAAPIRPGAARRVCSEFRTTTAGPQTCLPVLPIDGVVRWVFVEHHHGRNFLVIGAAPGSTASFDGGPLELGPAHGLPVAFTARLLPAGSFEAQIGDATGTETVNVTPQLLRAEGARQFFQFPGSPEAYLEPMVSSHPERDRWQGVAMSDGGLGYVEPSQWALEGQRGYDETIVLYDQRGRRIGYMGECRGVRTGDTPPPCAPVTTSG
jgi:hypothetical protein